MNQVMDEFTRPATLEDLKLLLRSLNGHGADCLLTQSRRDDDDREP